MNTIDDETEWAIRQVRDWREVARSLRSSTNVEYIEYDDDDCGTLLDFADDFILAQLESVHNWATFHKEVYGNAVAYLLRMDIEQPTFMGGCPVEHTEEFTDRPSDGLKELFGHWCVWLGAFWVNTRADAYWHCEGLGREILLTLRSADEVHTFDMSREYFYLQPGEEDTPVYEAMRDLAEMLSVTRKFTPGWDLDMFMSNWSGAKLRHHGRA